MEHEIILKCKSKKEIKCILNGLNLYRVDLIESLRNKGQPLEDYLKKDYEDTLKIVLSMIEDLEKDF